MDANRREFLKGAAGFMGLAAMSVGCSSTRGFGFGAGGQMALYADRPFRKLRVGVIGLGRGEAAINGFKVIPGCEITAICDLNRPRIAATLETLAKAGCPKPRVYTDSAEAWKALCDSPDVDLVYNATPWELHVPIALYAMRAGKHVATEVPAAFTVDECWELVETSERLRRHCMQLENCCYAEHEMLALNLVRKGLLGEPVHAECAYIHDLRKYHYTKWDDNHDNRSRGQYAYWDYWRLRWNETHKGNQYPTHGLGPTCFCLDINRGDRLDYLVSLESEQHCFEEYARAKFPADDPRRKIRVEMGDINSTLIKTALGRSILVQHDVSSPRPYGRIARLTGTKGIFTGYPYSVGWEEKTGDGVHEPFDAKRAEEIRVKYRHPLWQQAGELATKMGGHGGMDFLMVLRLAYCLQNGLPLDQNVYDLASWCVVCELSEKSVRNRSRTMDIPDFTRGAWRTTPRLGDLSVDLRKVGLA